MNGAVAVYNLSKKKLEFQTEAGHTETVFDLAFSPSNRDLLASVSYDGTIRLWQPDIMKLNQTIDTLKAAPLAAKKIEKHIIYSVTWHPFLNRLVRFK